MSTQVFISFRLGYNKPVMVNKVREFVITHVDGLRESSSLKQSGEMAVSFVVACLKAGIVKSSVKTDYKLQMSVNGGQNWLDVATVTKSLNGGEASIGRWLKEFQTYTMATIETALNEEGIQFVNKAEEARAKAAEAAKARAEAKKAKQAEESAEGK